MAAETTAAPAQAVARRMWSYLRAVFFMVRKGLLSNKRKLLLGMHLLAKRRNRAVARAVAGLLSHHHGGGHGNAMRRREYEFSCSNSPAGSLSASRRHLAYFPCLGALALAGEDLVPDAIIASSPTPLAARIESSAASASPAPSSPGLLLREEDGAAPGGLLSVRVSNYSSEEEGAGSDAVDNEAEEFIRRFYEQLRRQNTIVLLP